MKKGMSAGAIVAITLSCTFGGLFLLFIIAGLAGAFDTNPEAMASPSPTISPEQFKASCNAVDYEELARWLDKYMDKPIRFAGRIVQVQGEGVIRLRIAAAEPDDVFPDYDQIMLVAYRMPEGAPRFLEDDYVIVYGISRGIQSYYAILGNKISIPAMNAVYIDLISEE